MSDPYRPRIRHPLDDRLPGLLRSGQRLRGIFTGLPSPAIVEMCAYAGFDFVIIDNEHGCADLETTENMLRAARASGVPTVVRCLPQDLARVLDMGAGAVQIPMVNTADEARELVRRVRYPAVGERGSAFSSRAAGYGAFGGKVHSQRSNEGIALIAMVETPQGVANAGDIAAVPGVDAVFVGPNDLSHAMGFADDWRCDEVQRAITRALMAVSAAGKCAGTLALSPDDEERYAVTGARYFATVATGLITKALREAALAGGQRTEPLKY